MTEYKIDKIDEYRWKIARDKDLGMNVGVMIFADRDILDHAITENTLDQAVNVSCLPGIVKSSMTMPDIHFGYGFPIGGVAGFDTDDGVISPGGVGFDISCGVRLLRSDMSLKDVSSSLETIIYGLYSEVPAGVGSKGRLKLNQKDMDDLLRDGAHWSIDSGFGTERDRYFAEDSGRINDADPACVSNQAKNRGKDQLGTLGSGNHFLEVQRVTEIIDDKKAHAMGLFKGQITVMIHSGSRGLGHQVCSDYIKVMQRAVTRLGINIKDRQLACAPIRSEEGSRYYKAMSCAANFAMANRQCLSHWVRRVFEKTFNSSSDSMGMDLVYDVSHNIAKFEDHQVDGDIKQLCVHRKGATRSFPPGHKDLPKDYKDIGQPAIVPGDMGRCSYILTGTKTSMQDSFGSTCHGAGRLMSRTKAKKNINGNKLKRRLLEEKNIIVLAQKASSLAEEAPDAYKDVSRVARAVEGAGLSRIVARLEPLGVIKG